MTKSLQFYFDFASPYGFLASRKIVGLADAIGRAVVWRPFLIGAVYRTYGGAPLNHPLKKDYMIRDFARRATLDGLEGIRMPANFPASPVPPSRLTYWIEYEAPHRTGDFVQAAYRAYWIDGRDTADANVALDVAESIGLDRAVAADGMQEPAVKDRLRTETETAIARGVFGSPFIFVDGEPFWGGDRFQDIERLHGCGESRRAGPICA